MNKPNILFLMCDQLQKQPVMSGSQCITPNFDYLASIGTTFERAYTPNAVCSPARASLMTGLLPHNHGVLYVTHVVDDDQACLREDKPHWAQSLEKAGYHTGYFGKWHVERTNEVERYGFQVNGVKNGSLYNRKALELCGNSENPEEKLSLSKYHDEQPGYNDKHLFYGVTNVEPEKRDIGITTELALDFLDDAMQKDKSWCCFASLTDPHDPYVCCEETFAKYDMDTIKLPENIYDELDGRPNIYKKAARVWENQTERQKKEAMVCYYGAITEIDQQYGRLIKKIKKMGQLDNTIIILTTDHGELLGAHGLYCKNLSAYEEIYNIPLIMAGADIPEGAVSNARVGLHDLAQTLLELTGCETFNVPDSRSFAAVFSNPEEEKNFQKGYAEYFGGRILLTQRVVWDGDWKFVFNGFDFDELYNLAEDPYEMNNLIDYPEHQDIVRKLTAQMWKVIKETNDHSLYRTHYPVLRLAPFGPDISEE